MANFWAGVAQGFGPAYEASSRRRDKRADTQDARDYAKDQELDRLRAEYVRAGGTDTQAIAVDDRETLLNRITELKTRKATEVIEAEVAGAKGLPYVPASQELQSKFTAASLPRFIEERRQEDARKESSRLLGVEAAQAGALPSGDPLGIISKPVSDRELAARMGDLSRERSAAEAAAKRTLAIELKAIPRATAPAQPELSINDAVDGIIQMRAQLGPEGSRGPQPSREALLKMGHGPIMQLWGAFTDKIAVQKRKRDIEDYKKKGTGLSGSTRGYKEAAEAGLRYAELIEEIENDLKEEREPDPSKLREMKSHMAHVMAFYSHTGRLVPPHLEDLVRGAGRIPNNTILTDMALSHEMSMYAQSLGADVRHLIRKYGRDKMTAFIGPVQAPLSELLTTFGIDAKDPDRFIVNRLRQKYGDMANYKLFLQSGKAVTEQEYNRLKAVVGNPEREDFLDKLLGYAQLETERTQRKFKSYTDAGLRFNPELEKSIFGGEVTPQGSGGLSPAEDAELQKLKAAKAANLMDDAAKRRYLELLNKLAEEN